MIINIKDLSKSLVIYALALSLPAAWGAGDHNHAHDNAAADHSAEPVLVYTDYTQQTELFLEFPPLVAGATSTFVAHFTRLDNFEPLTSGTLDVHLKKADKTVARFRVREPTRAGIFLPDVTPRDAGEFDLVLEISNGDIQSTHALGNVTVFAEADATTVSQSPTEGEVSYLKEQQWDNPFAITRAEPRPLRGSVPGFATVMAPADGYAVVRAASDGYFSAKQFINAGQSVEQGQLLGTILPRLGEGADIGNLLVARERARSQLQLARADLARTQDLHAQGAVPEKRLLEAQQAAEVARVELETAESRIAQRTGNGGSAGIPLRAPIGGEVIDTAVTPGAFVRAGDSLFTVASNDRRWLNVQVPETFATDVHRATGVWLVHDQQPVVLDESQRARVVRISQQVNATTRTVDVAVEYPIALGPALIGQRLPARVLIGEPTPTLSVPASAILDDSGQPVVYVQSGGETFARRGVVTGKRDGKWVEIVSGVAPGEWVVSEGAYYVKLAATGNDAIGHGHAH